MQKCKNPECRVQFDPLYPQQKYHDPECRQVHYYARTLQRPYPGLTTTTVGDIGEYRVGVDLLKKGYDVFKSMCGNGWADLIVAVDRKLSTVGVRTGYRKAGTVWYNKRDLETDIVAVVLPDEIIYIPPF
jgi:hypothetical protein